METTRHLKITSKAHYILHGTSLSRPKMDTRGRHKNTTSISFGCAFGHACINKVGGAISNYCTPPQKVRGAILIYCARQLADHQGTQVVGTCS